jgi:hypothetical protein
MKFSQSIQRLKGHGYSRAEWVIFANSVLAAEGMRVVGKHLPPGDKQAA